MVACGDGVIGIGVEECDDGNLTGGDGCSPTCTLEDCGDGIVGPGEECEPPGTVTCSETCRRVLVNCGDGMVQTADGEQCDDANQVKGDGCHECRKECGDGRLDRSIGEECEPAYSPTICTEQCKRKPYCGDGKLSPEIGEECDPSNGTTCSGCKRVTSMVPDGGISCMSTVDAGVADPRGANLVSNGSFDSNLAGWNAASGVTAAHVADKGATAPGAVSVALQTASALALRVDGVERCVALPAQSTFDLEGSYFTPAGQATGVRAFPVVLLYAGPSCEGTPTRVNESAVPLSAETGRWLKYAVPVDTGQVTAAAGGTVSLLVKLGVLVPKGQTGSALWDDVSLRAGGLDVTCGNCVVDRGEICDDGNRVSGDGCSDRCQPERCGNGVVEAGEECDEGAAASWTGTGTCSPACRRKTACDACAVGMCRPKVDACLGLTGVAEAGPGKGESLAFLCGKLRACVHQSGCAGASAISARPTLSGAPGAFLENCFCGTAGRACPLTGAANGSCRDEVEAALETEDPTLIVQRVGGAYPQYPIFAALNELLACESSSCAASCSSEPKCGNGIKQERTATFASTHLLDIAGKKENCSDSLTPTKQGCTFEECDGGPGCDESCFLLKCGNGLKQTGEDCDDGNTTPGDGCSAACNAEYRCGDGVAATQFGEECDPPNTGPTCSAAEYKANPASCGCGPTCKYKGCGNGIVDAGEDCDPPGVGTCDASCKLVGLSECVQCLRLNTQGALCQSKLFLDGHPEFSGFACLGSKDCVQLVECRIKAKCYVDAPAGCYCGVGGTPAETQTFAEQCGTQETYQPTGPCKDLEVAAYVAQFGSPPANPPELINRFFDVPDAGKPVPFFSANALTDCVGNPNNFEADLRMSGVAESEIMRCRAACGAK